MKVDDTELAKFAGLTRQSVAKYKKINSEKYEELLDEYIKFQYEFRKYRLFKNCVNVEDKYLFTFVSNVENWSDKKINEFVFSIYYADKSLKNLEEKKIEDNEIFKSICEMSISQKFYHIKRIKEKK